MRVEFSGVQPGSTGRQQGAAGIAPAEEERKRAPESQVQREDGPRAEASARVSVSDEARNKLAEEASRKGPGDRGAADEDGAIARLLETQKERASRPDSEATVRPAPTRPSPDDQVSIRAAEQRLASAGLTT